MPMFRGSLGDRLKPLYGMGPFKAPYRAHLGIDI